LHRLALIVPILLLDACSGCGDSSLSGRADADTATEPAIDVTTEPRVDPVIDPLPEPTIDVPEMDPVEDPSDAGIDLVGDCTMYEDATIDTSHWMLMLGSEEYEYVSHVGVGHDGRIIVSMKQIASAPGRSLLIEIDGTGHVLAQTAWEGVIASSPDAGGQLTQSVLPLSDCGLLLAGTIQDAIGGLDVWLAKLDPSGTLLWQKALGGPGHDTGPSIIETRDGGIVVAAATESWARSYDFDLWMVKLDSDANIVWQECMGGFWDEDMTGPGNLVEAPDGTIFVTVNTRSFSDTNDAWLVSLDARGHILWQKSLSTGDIDDNRSIHALAYIESHLILAGSEGGYGGSSDGAWIVKMRPAGSIVWEKSIGSGFSTSAYGVLPRGGGGYLIAGRTYHERVEDNLHQLWLASLDRDGGIDWQKELGNEYHDMETRAVVHEDGIVIVGNHATSHIGPSQTDVIVARLGLDGSFSGTCAWISDGTLSGSGVTTPLTVTDVEARITDGVIVDAHSTFTDVDLPFTTVCPE